MAIPASLNVTELRFVKRLREACVPEVSACHAVAGFETACGETTREARAAAGEFTIALGVETVADGWGVRLPAGDVEDQRCEVHCDPVLRRPRDP